MHKLTENEINAKLSEFSGWAVLDDQISKKFKFKNFAQSLEFVNQVGAIAETQNHHPNIEFGWSFAEVFYTTHDVGGVSERDFFAAKEIDAIYNQTLLTQTSPDF